MRAVRAVVCAVTVAFTVLVAAPAGWAADIDPPTQPTNPRWTDASGVFLESVSAGDTTIHAAWDESTDAASGMRDYRVQLAETPNFTTVLADRYTGSTTAAAVFDELDGVAYGHTYYFRVAARDLADNLSSWSATSPQVAVREEQAGPGLAHAPVVTANYGQPILIEAVSTCRAGSDCAAALYYRETPPELEVTNLTIDLENQSGFTRVDMQQSQNLTLDGRRAVQWRSAIPGNVVTTRGVDYYVEVQEDFALAQFPGTTYVGTPHTPEVQGWGAYQHVDVLRPPLPAHTPPVFWPAHKDLPLEVKVACATGACGVTAYYRTTDATIDQTEVVAIENGELLAIPNWPRNQMDAVSSVPLRETGELVTYTTTIPAEYLDTRGVDYFFHVVDGHTETWLPGSTYAGHYAPRDGMRTGYIHVRALEPPHIIHDPVVSAPYRSEIRITAQINCAPTRTCSGTLYYRTAGSLLAATPFTETPMTPNLLGSLPDTDLLTLVGTIPSTVTDTRGVDYFIVVSDGATSSAWPGISPYDGYATNGLRVGWQNIHVLEPPHIAHAPIAVAPALQDLTIQTQITCATETCTADLTYIPDGNGAATAVTIPMARVSIDAQTDASRIETWRATVAASDITTRGLLYAIHAYDGYTNVAMPGTSYWGAYLPLDGQSLNVTGSPVMLPVRVLEPPHPAHAPTAIAFSGASIPLDVTTNCSSPTCTATLTWRRPGQPWQSASMTQDPATANGVPTFRGSIPAADVTTAGVIYRIDVSDGYVTSSTPDWNVTVVTPATLMF